MTSATVTSRGQITIPANVRQSLQLEAGGRVEFVEIGPRRFELVAATRSVTELKGMFGRSTRNVLLADMDSVIAARGSSSK